MNILKSLLLLLFLITYAITISPAQFRTTLTFGTTFDDNAFRNYLSQSESISSLGLLFDYQPGESDIHFYYNGNANLFKEYSVRQYFVNALGLSYAKSFGEDEENGWTIGANYFLRSNKEQFNYYDFNQFSSTANLKYYLNFENGLLCRAGYRLRYRNYSQLDEFTNLENYGFASLTKFFETKTTAIVEVALGNKSYVSSPTVIISDNTGNNGSGGEMENHSGMGNEMGENNSMMGSQLEGNMTPGTRLISYSSPTTTQFIGTLRLAQSITSTTGVSAQYMRRWDVSERTRFLSNGAVDFQGDEELWDDPYGYQSNEYNGTITQMLPWQVSVRLSLEYFLKDYARRIFLSADSSIPTGPFRDDTKFIGGMDIRKSFDDGMAFLNNITVNFSYFFQKNNSNDPYYNYKNNVLVLGISTQF